ncbi:hypothetical protein LWF01_17290 [Saxibacter everestensis]|uniref:Methylthioribose-1-phosphate isomerase n=1 Tax=Saxibacter everestensis TaxID=2909229 RepID=A0ABY8QS52_9MICO|nr:hypothetical protein LWF01_17290 [Brevibacteriaceae bacterium ZFBP1038]
MNAPEPTATLDQSIRLRGNTVQILDRRVFPEQLHWVDCANPAEVAAAIRDMVTQSSGPLYAAYAGMALAARQAADLPLDDARSRLVEAGELLANARPTNNHPKEAVRFVLDSLDGATTTAELVALAERACRLGDERYRARSRALAEAAVDLIPDGSRILTHCWMDSYLIELVKAAARAGRRYSWVATETRPYLQGARLTSHTLREMGEQVTLITDGMGAAALAAGRAERERQSNPGADGGDTRNPETDGARQPEPDGARQPETGIGRIDALVTAADRVSMDGHVVNKVGTLGLAVAAKAFGVPYYALVQSPDRGAPTGADIVIEQRDHSEVLEVLGRRTASVLVTDAWYPAFDATPPEFVTSVVTDRGAFDATALADYYRS